MNIQNLKRRLRRLSEKKDVMQNLHLGNEMNVYSYWGGFELGYLKGKISEIESTLDDIEDNKEEDQFSAPLTAEHIAMIYDTILAFLTTRKPSNDPAFTKGDIENNPMPRCTGDVMFRKVEDCIRNALAYLKGSAPTKRIQDN
jgi:hypothetical protein